MASKRNIILVLLAIVLLVILKQPISDKLLSLLPKKPSYILADQRYVNQALSQTGNYDPNPKQAYWENNHISIPQLQALNPNENILGLTSGVYAAGGEKWIEVDLNNQRLIAHEGDQIVFNFPVSSGLPWHPTVTGTFNIYVKYRFTRMTGGWGTNDFYDLPNVPYTMYFYKGYALHGAYWHNDFGHPRSHGCINISIPDSEKLYYWANPPTNPQNPNATADAQNPGTKLVIYGQSHL